MLVLMEFIIVGTAQPGFQLGEAEENALNEDHWAYMDRFASDLIARGPILSKDGEEWEGSIHIVQTDARSHADRFAFEEPYWNAGQYANVQVSRFENLLQSTMWERDREPDIPTSWLARWQWSPMLPSVYNATDLRSDNRLVFAGYLIDDDGTTADGFIAAIDASVDELSNIVDRVATRLGIANTPTIDRWRRGGRPDAS
jgi:uncharacterized protein